MVNDSKSTPIWFNNSTEINLAKGSGTGDNAGKAGYFKNDGSGNAVWENQVDSTLNGGSDMYVATVQGDLDFVKLEAWYAGLQDTFNTYTLAATSNLDLAENAKLGLEARYVNLQLNNKAIQAVTNATARTLSSDDNSMIRLAVDGKFSIVNARLAYTKTGKDGGLTALDQDAKNTSLGWAITSNGAVDANYFQAALGADILDNLNFTLHYGNIKAKDQTNSGKTFPINLTNYKAQEVYGQLTYKMSKNLSTYLRYGTYEEKQVSTGDKNQDQTRGRIQVAYTF